MATNTIQAIGYSQTDKWTFTGISKLQIPYLLKTTASSTNTLYLFYEVPTGFSYTGASYSIQFTINNNDTTSWQFTCESVLENYDNTITTKSQSTTVAGQSSGSLSISNNTSTSYVSTGYIRLKIKGTYQRELFNFIYLQSIPSLTVTYNVPKLILRADPSRVALDRDGDDVTTTLYFDNNLGNKVNYTLTANSKTLATGSNDLDPTWESAQYKSSKQIICDPDWFATAKETDSELNVTVTGQEDGGYGRTAQQTSFIVTMSRLGVTLTPPTSSGKRKYLTIAFSNRNSHHVYVTITGPKSTLFPRTQVDRDSTYSFDTNTETCKIPTPDSWFTNEDGSSIECTVLVEDGTWYRPVTQKFTLNASSDVLPVVSDLTLANIRNTHIPASYGYVANYSKVNISVSVSKGISPLSSVKVSYGGKSYDMTLTYESSIVNQYRFTTSSAITGATTFVVTATDTGKRSDTDEASITQSEITTLPNLVLTLEPSNSIDAGGKILLSLSNYMDYYSYTVKYGKTVLDSGSNLNATAEITTNLNWFGSYSGGELPVTIHVEDALGRPIDRNYRITKPAAIISDVTATNVPNPNMPAGYGYVANYSKVTITCKVQWYAEADTVVVSGGPTSNLPLTYNQASGTYSVTTPEITANTTFTITATDKAKRKSTATIKVDNVTQLSNITVSVIPSTVEIGKSTTIGVTNYIGKYSYSFKSGDKKFPSPSGSDITSASFTVTPPDTWFNGYTDGNRRQITVVIKDQLGREKNANFLVVLPEPNIKLDKTTVAVGETLTITFEGRAGRTITYTLTEKKTKESILIDSTSSDTPVQIPLTKQRYADVGIHEPSFQVVIKALYGTIEKTAEVTFALPELTASIEVDSVLVADDLTISFGGRADEGISFDFYYQTQKLGTTFGPYSAASATIEVPQYFDTANVKTSQNLPVTINVFDSYKRNVKITGLTILANDDMKPQFVGVGFNETTVNPPYTAIKFNGDDRSTLIVEADTRWLGRLFKCEVSNGTETVTTNTGEFIRPYTSIAAMIPEKVLAASGKNAEFHVTVLNAVGTVTYEWWASADGQEWVSISGATDSTLVVEATNEKLGWLFQCAVTDSNGTVWSNNGSFERPGGNLYASIPEKVLAAGDQYASFHVTVLNPGSGELTYRWLASDDGNTWFEVPAATQILPGVNIGDITRVSISGSYTQPTQAKITSAVAGFDSLTLPVTLQINQTTKTFSGIISTPLTVGDKNHYVTLKDERGMENSRALWWSYYPICPYHTPNVSVDSVARCDSNGTLNPSGDHCRLTVSYYLAEIYDPDEVVFPNIPKNGGELTVSTNGYTVSKGLGTTYDPDTHVYSYDYSGTETYIFPADIEHSFNITVTLRDYLQRVPLTVRLPTAEVIMDFKSGGQGVAIGKISEYNKMVEINPTWELKASVRINGQLYDLATLLAPLVNNQQGG